MRGKRKSQKSEVEEEELTSMTCVPVETAHQAVRSSFYAHFELRQERHSPITHRQLPTKL